MIKYDSTCTDDHYFKWMTHRGNRKGQTHTQKTEKGGKTTKIYDDG